MCNARVEVTGSTQLNAPNFVIKESSVMLVATNRSSNARRKVERKGCEESREVRREQGGRGKTRTCTTRSFVYLRLSIAQVHPSKAKRSKGGV